MTDQDLLQAVVERTKKLMGADALRDIWNDGEEARKRMRDLGLNAGELSNEALRDKYNALSSEDKTGLTQAYMDALQNKPERQNVSLETLAADLPGLLDDAQEKILMAALRVVYGDTGLARAEKGNNPRLDSDITAFYDALVKGNEQQKDIGIPADKSALDITTPVSERPSDVTGDLGEVSGAATEKQRNVPVTPKADGRDVSVSGLDEATMSVLEQVTRTLAETDGSLSRAEFRDLKRDLKDAGVNTHDGEAGLDISAGRLLKAMERYDAAMEKFLGDAELTKYYMLEDDAKGRPQLVKREEAFEQLSESKRADLEEKAEKFTRRNLEKLDAKMDFWVDSGKEAAAEAVTAFTTEVYGSLTPASTPDVDKDGRNGDQPKKNPIIRGN